MKGSRKQNLDARGDDAKQLRESELSSGFTSGQTVSGIQPLRANRTDSVALLAANGNFFAQEVLQALKSFRPGKYQFVSARDLSTSIRTHDVFRSCIYVPSFADRDGMTPDIAEANRALQHAGGLRCTNFILLSSALVYGAGCGRQGLAPEEYSPPRDQRDRISGGWSHLESLACMHLGVSAQLTILRPVTVLPSPARLSRLLLRRAVPTVAGHDPVVQFLSISDLAEAICCALEKNTPGTFNVAPNAVVPLHTAIRIAGSHRISIPRTAQRLAKSKEVLEYLRYPWTVANEKIKKELSFVARKSSGSAILEHKGRVLGNCNPEQYFDEFGMDKSYIEFYGKTLFKFLCDYYWRIETDGLEHIPRQGPGVLVGSHRGFMPFDGVMSLHILVKHTGRFPRFLTHPGLLKFPFLANFMTKLGGVVACQDTAERILKSGELVGIFPEGIHGAFSYYRDAYKLQGFGREAFIKLALRNRAPILPYVVVGSAEIFPVFGKINSRFWTRHTEWPCIPLTPTFPLLPVPLPSKWHMKFLAPIHVEQSYGPDAARDRTVVKTISAEVRGKMQDALDQIVGQRRRIFWGSVFAQGGRS